MTDGNFHCFMASHITATPVLWIELQILKKPLQIVGKNYIFSICQGRFSMPKLISFTRLQLSYDFNVWGFELCWQKLHFSFPVLAYWPQAERRLTSSSSLLSLTCHNSNWRCFCSLFMHFKQNTFDSVKPFSLFCAVGGYEKVIPLCVYCQHLHLSRKSILNVQTPSYLNSHVSTNTLYVYLYKLITSQIYISRFQTPSPSLQTFKGFKGGWNLSHHSNCWPGNSPTTFFLFSPDWCFNYELSYNNPCWNHLNIVWTAAGDASMFFHWNTISTCNNSWRPIAKVFLSTRIVVGASLCVTSFLNVGKSP